MPYGEYAPLSREQEPLWLHDRLDMGQNAAYRMRVSLRLTGPLAVPAFRVALSRVVARHDVLRTSFLDRGGEPVQVAAPPGPVLMPLDDLRGADADCVSQMFRADMQQPLDVEQGPPYRMRLARIAEDDYIWSAVLHHLVFDAASRGVLCADIRALYLALVHGGAELPPLQTQYADFAIRQRTGEPRGDQRGWAPSGAVAACAPRVPRAAVRARADRYMLDVPAGIADGTRAFSRRSGVTVYTTLLAVFVLLLARYKSETELTVGVPITSRRGAWLAPLVGCFANLAALHAKIRLASSFHELLESVRLSIHERLRHQEQARFLDLPAIFAWHGASTLDPDWGDVRARLTSIDDPPAARADLEVHGTERHGRWELTWTYNTEAYERWHSEQMGRHYVGLLLACVTTPDVPIGDLALVDAPGARLHTHQPSVNRCHSQEHI